MMKGSTVGVNPGTRETWGAPTIGDDVLIAPNTLVNRDVPSHSIVIGCPMKIVHRDHATKYFYPAD